LTSSISLPIKNLLNQKVKNKLFWHKKCLLLSSGCFFDIAGQVRWGIQMIGSNQSLFSKEMGFLI